MGTAEVELVDVTDMCELADLASHDELAEQMWLPA